MDRENDLVSKERAPDHVLQSPRGEPDWREIAEEASKEQDGAKLIELAKRLIDAFDNQEGAHRPLHVPPTPLRNA